MQQQGEIIRGADIFVRALCDEGVKHIFGYPGGAVLHIYDALFKCDEIDHILVRHEQGATHAADGYARATGKPGVILITSGPGITNCITGIATAHMDSIPLVVFSGQVPRALIGDDAFQEVDCIGITRPCVKHNFLVKRIEDLAPTIKKAFYIATTGRPGPVVVDIPKDITAEMYPYHYPDTVSIRSYRPVTKGHGKQIKRAMDLMLRAQRPIFYTGGGIIISGASQELRTLVKRLGFPITQTLMGLGAYPANDPLSLGMLGMHGTYEANMAMHHCDVLIAIGSRFDDRVTGDLDKFCPKAEIIHVDIDPSSISKNVTVDIPIVGDCKYVLSAWLDLTNQLDAKKQALSEWWNQISQWRNVDCLQYDKKSDLIKPQFVIEQAYEATKGKAFVSSDVGQHQMWAAQFYRFDHPRLWINSGGLGTMGFGLPAALGVKVAFPDDTVLCVTGEASLVMCIQELSTCKQYGLPIKILNLNNRYMGMVRQWQEFFYAGRYSHSYMDALPDFVKLAESFGHVGMRVERPEDVRGAIEESLSLNDRLVLIDFITDQTENVYPMVAAGKGQHEMHLGPIARELA